MKRNKGFTLVELLIVIAIVAILAMLGGASYQTSIKRSRDARRAGDVEQIRAALEMYRTNEGAYPDAATVETDLEAGYIANYPKDPLTDAAYTYNPTGSPPTSYDIQYSSEITGSMVTVYSP